MMERLPGPLQALLRRVVLRVRIHANQLLSMYRFWSRRWHRRRSSDSKPWRMVDLSGQGDARIRHFCISLLEDARFESRRLFFQRNAKKFGWPVEFWPAVNGVRFRTENYPEWIRPGNKADMDEPFGAGAVGLLMTVKEIYQWAWEQELELLVIFEDDAVIHSSPRVELPEEFDVVFFNNRIQGDSRGLVKHGWGNDGYVISRRGIQKMLKILEHVTADIDMLMMMYTKSLEEYGPGLTCRRDTSKPQLDCYHVGPLVTHAGYFQSSIGMITGEAGV